MNNVGVIDPKGMCILRLAVSPSMKDKLLNALLDGIVAAKAAVATFETMYGTRRH